MPTQERKHSYKVQRVVLHAVFTLSWLSLAATQYFSTVGDREAALQAARANSQNLANSLAQHAGDTFRIADSTLAGIVSRLEDNQAVDMTDVHQFLVDEVGRSDRIHGLFVYDCSGNWVTSSLDVTPRGVNNADREYFRYHRSHYDQLAYVGKPVRSRSDGHWIATISRRYERPDGGFGGVVLASIELRYFEDFYSRFETGRHGTIGITLDDGTILARLPRDNHVQGRSIAGSAVYKAMTSNHDGTLVYRSPIDGVVRISGYAKVDGFPLHVLAGVSQSEALSAWRSSLHVRIALTVIGIVALILASWWLDGQLHRNHRRERRLRERAEHDALTGLFNRGALDGRLQQLSAASEKSPTALTVMMLDVDDFKRYNDALGHAAGDTCLRQIAQVLKSEIRETDFLARYGGEEFAVVMPGCDLEQATKRAQDMVNSIWALGIQHPDSSAASMVTASIGVATRSPGQSLTPGELLAQADKALYSAKQGGRNRFCAWDSGGGAVTNRVLSP